MSVYELTQRLLEVLQTNRKTKWTLAEKLIDDGADVTLNPAKPTAHKQAIVHELVLGPTALLKKSLKLGMPVSPRSLPHEAIERAISSGNMAHLQLLIEYGADLHGAYPLHRWSTNWTAEPYEIAYNKATSKRILASLLKLGADINQYDKWGRTPLMFCIELYTSSKNMGELYPGHPEADDPQHYERAMMLINSGADVNLPSRNKAYDKDGRFPIGSTPLFVRPYGDGSFHKALLKAGANPLARCLKPRRWNALEFAELQFHRLTHDGQSPLEPGRTKPINYESPPFHDDPKVVKNVITAMKRAAKNFE